MAAQDHPDPCLPVGLRDELEIALDLYNDSNSLQIDIFRVGPSVSVRITHMPTGTVVQSDSGHSEIKLKKQAMQRLVKALKEQECQTG